jgi:hypothetical protein
MLRLVLLVLYLIASSFASPSDYGSGYDPDGASSSPAGPTSDYGGGYDPNG